jgi:hypothetical protein
MIVWIAGWPHNGSTLCRQILKDSFEISTASCYLESELEPLFPGGEAFFKCWDRDKITFHSYLVEHNETYFVKTHELPLDNCPAIFVYRDGRDSVTALSNFWKMPIESAICGIGCPFGTWSSYYHGWNPKHRPNTLMVRFEDMVENPNKVASEISGFIHFEQKHDYVDDFELKKMKYPYLFKDRLNAYKKRFYPEIEDMFWRCHGAVMKELGYER